MNGEKVEDLYDLFSFFLETLVSSIELGQRGRTKGSRRNKTSLGRDCGRVGSLVVPFTRSSSFKSSGLSGGP